MWDREMNQHMQMDDDAHSDEKDGIIDSFMDLFMEDGAYALAATGAFFTAAALF